MFTASRTPNQIRLMSSFCRDWRQQRNDDECELEEIEKEGEKEHQNVDDDQKADLSARQIGQQMLDPLVAVDR